MVGHKVSPNKMCELSIFSKLTLPPAPQLHKYNSNNLLCLSDAVHKIMQLQVKWFN